MRRAGTTLLVLAAATGPGSCDARVVTPPSMHTPASLEHRMHDLGGSPVSLKDFRGDVLLLVNVASHCGYTGQYRDLQQLQDRYGDRGFTVIGFPCNDFGGQEPGDAGAIAACAADHGAGFPIMEKIRILDGPEQSPIYASLQQATGALPRWNFGKYLIDRKGHPVAFYGTRVEPLDTALTDHIESLLQQ